MDYELIYEDFAELAETLKSQLSNQQRLLKRINKGMSSGDIRNTAKDIAAFIPSSDETGQTIDAIRHLVDGIDVTDYLESNDFAKQLIRECKERDVDIVGENRSYEIFPYRLRINPPDGEVLINGKKAPGLRPAAVADFLAKGKAKLLSANFNADKFAAELASAYDNAIIVGAKGKKAVPDADVYLNTIYKFLAPMGRFRRDYDAQSYAFDIARLYNAAEGITLADGRKIQFGPSRVNNRAIRILDAFGNELFIATVRFYK
ncbi:MAG: hypothetical protein LBO70_06930 [Clostridiales Family XIII bacterium]|nr:hypothetical protein [Clostridiales Family XIII bacterium]